MLLSMRHEVRRRAERCTVPFTHRKQDLFSFACSHVFSMTFSNDRHRGRQTCAHYTFSGPNHNAGERKTAFISKITKYKTCFCACSMITVVCTPVESKYSLWVLWVCGLLNWIYTLFMLVSQSQRTTPRPVTMTQYVFPTTFLPGRWWSLQRFQFLIMRWVVLKPVLVSASAQMFSDPSGTETSRLFSSTV